MIFIYLGKEGREDIGKFAYLLTYYLTLVLFSSPYLK